MTNETMTQPKLMTLRARGTQEEGVRTAIKVRRFAMVMDEPAELGGTDLGPNPMEYVLGSLIGCASVMLRIISQEQGLTYEGADFDLRGVLDIRGLEGVPGVCRYFQKVTGTVRVQTQDAAKLASVAAAIEDRCPVFTMLKAAGTEMEIAWEAVGA